MSFRELGLAEPLLRAVDAEGYTTPTPIQSAAIPPSSRRPRPAGHRPNRDRQNRRLRSAHPAPVADDDPASSRSARDPRPGALADPRAGLSNCRQFSRRTVAKPALRHTTIFGGVGQGPQVRVLRHGIDILVATPGRLLDLLDQGHRRPQARRDPGPRRGRSHARYGLSARRPPHRSPPSDRAADDSALGNHAAADRRVGRLAAQQPDSSSHRPGRGDHETDRTVRLFRRGTAEASGACAILSKHGQSIEPSCSRAPSEAPTAS